MTRDKSLGEARAVVEAWCEAMTRGGAAVEDRQHAVLTLALLDALDVTDTTTSEETERYSDACDDVETALGLSSIVIALEALR